MREQGIVTEISGNIAKIRLIKKPECLRCGLCSGTSGEFRILSIKVDKPLQLNQTVTLQINEQILILSSILMYGVPLTGLVAGGIVGYMIGKELIAIIFAIGLAASDFLFVKFIIKKQNLAEKAVKICEDEE